MLKTPVLSAFLFVATAVYAQTPADSAWRAISRFPFENTGLLSSGPARAGVALIDAGARAMVRGEELGALDISIDGRSRAHAVGLSFGPLVVTRSIMARPEGLTIVYSHATFTVREHVFAALTDPGALVVLEVETVRPLDINVTGSMPFTLRVDSARAANQYFAIAFAGGDSPAILRQHMLGAVHGYWLERVAHARHVRNEGVAIDVFDTRIAQALEWAKIGADRFGNAAPDEQRAHALADTMPRLLREVAAMSDNETDADSADALLREIGASSTTADWGERIHSRYEAGYDALRYDGGAVVPFASAFSALAFYNYHRDWAAFDLLRDLSNETFDFTRGRIPPLLSGAYYQALDGAVPNGFDAATLLVDAFVRGLIGWQTDVAHHAAALEPHMPAEWPDMKLSNLRVGRDRIDATLSRVNGVYRIALHRLTAGAPIALRIAPALPLGASVDRIVVNDEDVPVQSEETAHDVHAVAEIQLAGDAEIEIHYEGGIDVLTPPEHVDIGEASHELKVVDFRRAQRDYLITIEGIAASSYTVLMRSSYKVRAVMGSDSFEQNGERVTIRTTTPPGIGYTRKTMRVRVDQLAGR